MKFECKHIEEVVSIAKTSGNDVTEVSEGWAKVKQVVHMKGKLSDDDKNEIAIRQPILRHWSTQKTPHNVKEEGYTCDECEVAITFPK